MADFDTDNQDVEKLLMSLCNLIVENGGFIDDRLTFTCKKGDLRVIAPKGIDEGKAIISLPGQCLLPLDLFDLVLQGNDLVLKAYDKSVSDVRLTLMRKTIELYNRTNKIEFHKKTSLFGTHYHDPALAAAILSCRDYEDLLLYKKVQSMNHMDFILYDYIHTRGIFTNDRKQGNEQAFYAAPIIDCTNHSGKAYNFMALSGNDMRNGLSILGYCSPGNTRECFVSYGFFDAADTLILHNFVDENASFVRSVPLTIEIPGTGVLRIQSGYQKLQQPEIPQPYQDLFGIFPGFASNQEKREVILSFICLPQENKPGALRRILLLAWGQIISDERRLKEAVLISEAKIIDENLIRYTKILTYLESYAASSETETVVKNARLMAQTQIRKIKMYPLFEESAGRYKKVI